MDLCLVTFAVNSCVLVMQFRPSEWPAQPFWQTLCTVLPGLNPKKRRTNGRRIDSSLALFLGLNFSSHQRPMTQAQGVSVEDQGTAVLELTKAGWGGGESLCGFLVF